MSNAPDARSQVDDAFASVAEGLFMLRHVNPTNEAACRERFLAAPGPGNEPRFEYQPLSFDPAARRAELAGAPVDAISRPELAALYAARRAELVTTIELLEARDSPAFLPRSMALFGRPDAALIAEAEAILDAPWEPELADQDDQAVRKHLLDHLAAYQARYPDFECEVVITPHSSSALYVHGSRVMIKQGVQLSRSAAVGNVCHEIDAHVLTYLNGQAQDIALARLGLRGYLDFQENLGIFTELVAGTMHPERRVQLAARVVAVGLMADGLRFSAVFEALRERDVGEQSAYIMCQRVFRGGGFTKDWTYVSQLEELCRYWAEGGDMSVLILGKVNLADRVTIEALLADGSLSPPRFLPPYFADLEARRSEPAVQSLWSSPGSRPTLGALLSLFDS